MGIRSRARRMVAVGLSAAIGLTMISLAAQPAFATTYPEPPQGYFAGTTNSVSGAFSATDPINVVVHVPNGSARNIFEQAIVTNAALWGPNTCYNKAVGFDDGSGSGDRSPDASYATDLGTSGDIWPFSGCGRLNVERNHLREWARNDGTTIYIAASYEYPTGNVTNLHQVATNGFNRGRDGLAADLARGLAAIGYHSETTLVHKYGSGSFTQGGSTIPFDGNVSVLNVTLNNTTAETWFNPTVNKPIDLNQSNPANGTQIQIWTFNNSAAQWWIRYDYGNGYYKLVSKATGKCIDIVGPSTADGTKVHEWDCYDTNSQLWHYEYKGTRVSGYPVYQLRNKYSGKCLDITGFGTTDGTPLQQWSCSGGSNQEWF